MNNQTKLYTVDEIRQILNPIFEKSGVIKAVLFGSYANNTANADSDVDIIVEVEDWVDDLDFCGISVDISDSLCKNVDFLTFSDLIPDSAVEREIKETGRVIFEKNR